MQAAVWQEFQDSQFYGKFKGKFNGKAPGIVRALEAHYSNDGGFDGFFNDCFRLEADKHMSEDQILEAMREKAEESLFKAEMGDLAEARGMGEKGPASILGRVYMESGDRQRHLMRNYLKLIEEGADRQKIGDLVMERYGPNHMKLEERGAYMPELEDIVTKGDGPKAPGNGSSWWGNLKKYGKKPVTWAALAAVAGLVYTCNVEKLGKHDTQERAPAKIEERIQPGAQEAESLCPPKFKKLSYVSKEKEVILPMPEGSQRVGPGNNYKVVLRGNVQQGDDGVSRVRIRQNVRPHAGVDAIGILSGNGWVCGKPGEYISVELTPGELGKYTSGEGANFQVAALKSLAGGMYQSMGSYRNLFVKK